jgi:hypothetical protein
VKAAGWSTPLFIAQARGYIQRMKRSPRSESSALSKVVGTAFAEAARDAAARAEVAGLAPVGLDRPESAARAQAGSPAGASGAKKPAAAPARKRAASPRPRKRATV